MSEPVQREKESPPVAGAVPPPTPANSPEKMPDAAALSPEEQMARFEDALKESDWGHQPC